MAGHQSIRKSRFRADIGWCNNRWAGKGEVAEIGTQDWKSWVQMSPDGGIRLIHATVRATLTPLKGAERRMIAESQFQVVMHKDTLDLE